MNLDRPNFPQGAMFSTTNVPDATETLYLDVSTKPMIGLVWLGTLLYTAGGLVAYRRRALETGLLGTEPEEEPAPAPEAGQRPTAERRGKRTRRLAPEPARAVAPPSPPARHP
jgi:hypothetical protein